jgi:membrane protease YdiL (CAAX protease family)
VFGTTRTALRAYLRDYPLRLWHSGHNARVQPLLLAFTALALVVRYAAGVSPFIAPQDGAARIVTAGVTFCLIPCAVPLLLVAACGGFERRPDRRFWVSAILTVAALVLNQYGGVVTEALLHNLHRPGFESPGLPARLLLRNGYNLRAIACYLAAPALYWIMTPALRAAPFFGLTRRGFVASVYVLLLAAALPFLVAASWRGDFLQSYPRFQPGGGAGLLGADFTLEFAVFECLYALQFVALEIFFRGYLLAALERYVGSAAVAVMTVIYCSIHFVKPWPEAAAAILGGYLLGGIAFYTRSILGGVVMHIGIALTLEVLALLRHAG